MVRNGIRGYTLLEVTVALVIVGISITVYFGQLSRAKAIAIKSDTMIDAVRILNNLWLDSEITNMALSRGSEDEESHGEVPGESGWTYSMTAKPLKIKTGEEQDLSEMDGLWRITLCISREDAPKNYCSTRWDREK